MKCSKCKSFHVKKTKNQQECLKCGHVDKRSRLISVNVNKAVYTQGEGIYYDLNAFKRKEVEELEILREAAPEMLAALFNAKQTIEDLLCARGCEAEWEISDYRLLLDAIAKATGKEES